MTPKTYLQQFPKLNRMITNKAQEQLQLPKDSAQRTAIDSYIVELYKRRNAIIAVIEQLKLAEYDLLHKVYVQEMPLKEVAYRCGKSYSWATTTHSRALLHVQEILDSQTS